VVISAGGDIGGGDLCAVRCKEILCFVDEQEIGEERDEKQRQTFLIRATVFFLLAIQESCDIID
jgi:hypothetical protein